MSANFDNFSWTWTVKICNKRIITNSPCTTCVTALPCKSWSKIQSFWTTKLLHKSINIQSLDTNYQVISTTIWQKFVQYTASHLHNRHHKNYQMDTLREPLHVKFSLLLLLPQHITVSAWFLFKLKTYHICFDHQAFKRYMATKATITEVRGTHCNIRCCTCNTTKSCELTRTKLANKNENISWSIVNQHWHAAQNTNMSLTIGVLNVSTPTQNMRITHKSITNFKTTFYLSWERMASHDFCTPFYKKATKLSKLF